MKGAHYQQNDILNNNNNNNFFIGIYLSMTIFVHLKEYLNIFSCNIIVLILLDCYKFRVPFMN